MDFTKFVRKPFLVEAVKVTKENISEIAELVGTIQKKEDGTPYIKVDRRLFLNVDRVYPGFWMTKMGDRIRCYSKQVFEKQFTEVNSHNELLVRKLSNPTDEDKENDPI